MTATTAVAPAQRGTVLATVEKVRARDSREQRERRDPADCIIGLRAQHPGDLPEDLRTQHGERVTVAWCPSELSMWDAMHHWDRDGWLVMLTDRQDSDLGTGVIARLAHNRLLSPDPWESVTHRFRATAIDRALLAESRATGTAVPDGLMRAEPRGQESGWPPVRAGVLTRDHAYGAVAHRLLALPNSAPDGHDVLAWTLDPVVPTHLADLRRDGGDALADAVLTWLAERTGGAAPTVRHLLASGATDDVLPLGLALGHLIGAPPELAQEAALAGARLETRLGPDRRGATRPGAEGPAADQIRALGTLAETTVRDLLLHRPTQELARTTLQRAERILRAEQAPGIIADSALLPGGLTARHRALAAALGVDARAAEDAWTEIGRHPLSRETQSGDRGIHAVLEAAIRLDRWLATAPAVPAEPATDPRETATAAARTHVHDGAWAENALNTVQRGSDDPEIATALERLATRVLDHRRELDRAFAASLAPLAAGAELPSGDPRGDVRYLETVLDGLIAPLATSTADQGGVLLLLLDGMSAAAATHLVEDLTHETGVWREIHPLRAAARTTALALLPTITEHSRTSFFTGAPTSGGQSQERTGIETIARRAGLAGTALFHKDDLLRRTGGTDLGDAVAAAIADPTGTPLVAGVLNTIDDALDSADPGGTDWGRDTIRFLRPLLLAAARAHRTVVLTADHGHVIERDGRHQPHADARSARWRPADGAPAQPDEIRVEGSRVLSNGSAILAVDENLRFTGRRAGYHGGAALAEVAVPVVVLQPEPVSGLENEWIDALPDGWTFATSNRPLWWEMRPSTDARPPEIAPSAEDPRSPLELDLFGTAPATTVATALGDAVVTSMRYADQKATGPRAIPADDTVAALIDALATAPGTRVPLSAASQLLGVAPARTVGAIGIVSQLLNVEGFEVLRREDDLVILDVPTLRQQFEVT